VEHEAGRFDDPLGGPKRDLVARAHDEGLEREALRARLLPRRHRDPLRRLPLGHGITELAVDDQPDLGVSSSDEPDRPLDQREVFARDPVARELTGDLEREVVRLLFRHPHGRDPELEVFSPESAAKLPLRFRPDGVDHPPSPRTPELTSSTRSPRSDDASTHGDNSVTPTATLVTVAVDTTTTAPPPPFPLCPPESDRTLRPITFMTMITILQREATHVLRARNLCKDFLRRNRKRAQSLALRDARIGTRDDRDDARVVRASYVA